MTRKRHKGTPGDKGSVLYLDCGDGYTCATYLSKLKLYTLNGTIFICKLS